MANNPSFSFYVNDFEGGTRHMTDAELGCYLRVLLAQFNRKGVLPNDEKFLKRFCTSFDESWPIVKEKFHDVGGGLLQNKRLEIERVKKEKFIENQRENGRKGGRPKEPDAKPKRNPKETQPFDLSKPKQKPLGNGYGNTNNEEKVSFEGAGNFSFDEKTQIAPNVLEAAEMNQFTHTRSKNTEFVKSQWGIFLKERMNDPPVKQREYKQLSDLGRYFLNFLRDKFPSKNGHSTTTAIGKTFEPD